MIFGDFSSSVKLSTMIEWSVLKSIFSLEERCPFVFFERCLEFDGVLSGGTHKMSYKGFTLLEESQIGCLKYFKNPNSFLKFPIVSGASQNFFSELLYLLYYPGTHFH